MIIYDLILLMDVHIHVRNIHKYSLLVIGYITIWLPSILAAFDTTIVHHNYSLLVFQFFFTFTLFFFFNMSSRYACKNRNLFKVVSKFWQILKQNHLLVSFLLKTLFLAHAHEVISLKYQNQKFENAEKNQ